METICITKEFSWDMAHMLANHQGLCKNLHGHTYKMQITVQSANDALCEEKDMVMDFKDLKEIVKERIVDKLDHAFVYMKNSPDSVETSIAEILIANGRKTFGFDFRPTAEKMGYYFYNEVKDELEQNGIIIKKLTLWETPTSFVEICGE